PLFEKAGKRDSSFPAKTLQTRIFAFSGLSEGVSRVCISVLKVSRVGVSPGYPPVGAAHCAPARTLRLPHAMFARFQRSATNWSGFFQPENLSRSIQVLFRYKMQGRTIA
ncbi:MAG: hypothetical protein LBR60_05085, partial [Fibrobacter sp.]|nr:hypothetical protein [Fibrobacter sp.]